MGDNDGDDEADDLLGLGRKRTRLVRKNSQVMYNNTIYKEYKDVNCNNKKVFRVQAAAILIRWRLGAGE